jgi:hypothetical protein
LSQENNQREIYKKKKYLEKFGIFSAGVVATESLFFSILLLLIDFHLNFTYFFIIWLNRFEYFCKIGNEYLHEIDFSKK